MTTPVERYPSAPLPRTFLLFHCETEQFSLAKFSVSEKSSLILLHYKTFPLSLAKSSLQEITKQLQNIRSSWKLQDAPVYCLLAANILFLRRTLLKIPLNLHHSLSTIAQLEAEQIIPYPLSKVVWDYQILEILENESTEIIYAAIKKELIEPLCETIENAGFTITSINVLPAALVNGLSSIEADNNKLFETSFCHALQAAPLLPHDIDLLPASLIARRKHHQRFPYFVVITVLVSCSLLACSFFYTKATKKILAATSQATLLLYQEKQASITLDKKLTAAEDLKKNRELLASLINSRSSWSEIFEELQKHLPSHYLWITKLSPVIDEKNKKSITAIAIDGLYLENPAQAQVVDHFVEELKKSLLFEIRKFPQEKIITRRSTPDGTAYAYGFSLYLPLSKSIP